MELPGVKNLVKQWARDHGCEMAECHYRVPRKVNILQEWGIVNNGDEEILDPSSIKFQPNDHVHTVVRFPSSLLSEEDLQNWSGDPKDLHENGALKLNQLDFSKLTKDVPLVVYFHGGGLVMGFPDTLALAEDAYNLASDFKKQHGDETIRKMITVSVDYGIAPDCPFPAGIIDALSVIDHILKADPNRNIAIYGMSAGGNIAMVAGLEAFRKYASRIFSVSVIVPMLSPASDSRSYYMNEYSGGIAPVSWLRWAWRAYLQLDAPPNEEEEDDVPNMDNHKDRVKELLRKNSNHSSWTKSKWYASKTIRRLIEPIHDLPSGLDQETAPTFLVATNAADPLLDDGKSIFDSLKKAGAKVNYIECPGSHFMGYKLDKEYEQKRRDLLSEQIWKKDLATWCIREDMIFVTICSIVL